MGIKLLPGVYSAAVGLAGAGAVMVAPTQLWIGYSLFFVAGLLLIWGIRINDRHLWGSWPGWLSKHVWWRFRLKPPGAPESFSSGLYVGELRLAANHLDEGYLELSVRGFNGTGETIDVAEVQGNILLERADAESVQLPPAVLLSDRTQTKAIAPRAEIFLALQQFVNPQIAQIIGELIDGGGASFTLTGFKIEMAVTDNPKKRAALPFWGGIRVTRDRWARSDRIIHAVALTTVTARASIGASNDG